MPARVKHPYIDLMQLRVELLFNCCPNVYLQNSVVLEVGRAQERSSASEVFPSSCSSVRQRARAVVLEFGDKLLEKLLRIFLVSWQLRLKSAFWRWYHMLVRKLRNTVAFLSCQRQRWKSIIAWSSCVLCAHAPQQIRT